MSVDRKTIISRWKRLLFLESLRVDEVVVGFHASMVMQAITEEASKLVFHVPTSIYKLLVKHHGETTTGSHQTPCVRWMDDVYVIEGLPLSVDEIDGVRVMSVDYLRFLVDLKGGDVEKALLSKFPRNESFDFILRLRSLDEVQKGLELTEEERMFYDDLVNHNWKYENESSLTDYRKGADNESRLRELAYTRGGNHLELYTRMLRLVRPAA